MSFFKTRRLAALSLAVLGSVALASTSAVAEVNKHTFKLGHFSILDSTYGEGLVRFADIVEEKSDGKMTVKIYNSGQLGNEAQQLGALRGGIQDFFLVSSSPLTELAPKLQILDFPGLLKSRPHAYEFLDGDVGQEMLDQLSDKGIKGLAYWENGFRQFTNNKRPIKSVDDFAGLKVRVIQNPLYIGMFENLGTHAVQMPFNELYTALETGIADAQDNSMLTNEMAKFDEVQKYLTLTNHIYNPMVLLGSQKNWDALTDEEREIIQDAALEAGKYNREISQEAVESFIKKFADNGVTVDYFDEDETRKMTEKMLPAIKPFEEKLDADFIKRAYEAAGYQSAD